MLRVVSQRHPHLCRAFAFSIFFGYHDAAINDPKRNPRMHLQQTKSESRASGGPQYYFHTVPPAIKDFLRQRGACPVILETPYGIATSSFMAVGRDHKLTGTGQIIAGSVGHDRIQQGSRQDSISSGSTSRSASTLKAISFLARPQSRSGGKAAAFHSAVRCSHSRSIDTCKAGCGRTRSTRSNGKTRRQSEKPHGKSSRSAPITWASQPRI